MNKEFKTKKEYQKTVNNYRIKKIFYKILNLTARYCLVASLRYKLWKLIGVNIGKNVFIGIETMIDDEVPFLITIEDYSMIAPRCMLIAHDGSSDKVAPITIKKGAWVGAGTIILRGVSIGENSMVGAGSVVTKDIPANTVYAGVPAKYIKDVNPIDTENRIKRIISEQ